MSLGDEFTLCASGGRCIGVTYGGRKGEILVSFKSGAIQVYNIHDFGMLCSWQLPTSEQLVCGAIVDPSTDHYWALTSPQGLWQWTREDTVLSNSSEYSVYPDPAQLLLCSGCLSPLIVYYNGDVGVVGGATVGLAPKKVRKWILAMTDISCDKTVCVVGRGREVSVGIAELAEGQIQRPITVSLKCKGAELVSCCVCQDKLLLLLQEGLWMVAIEPPLQPTPTSHTFSPSLPTHLATLSRDYFIMANARSLQLWDSRYFTCQHCIETTALLGSKVWCVEGCVLSGSQGGGVRGWRVDHLPTSSRLSAAIGKSTVKSPATVLLSWPLLQKELNKPAESAPVTYLQALISREELAAKHFTVQDTKTPKPLWPTALLLLSNSGVLDFKTPDLHTFMTVFRTQPLTPDICYDDVIERLLSEQEFWGHEALSDLLQANLVPSNVEVLSAAVSKGDWSVVELCLTCGPTPSESSIVNTVQKLLSLTETLRCISGNIVSRTELLYKVICQPFNDDLMYSPLSTLSQPVVKQLLMFLTENVSVASLLTPPSHHTPPPYDMILEWIVLVLDVHFTRIVLDSQCRQHLLELQSKVLTQVNCFSRLSCIFSLEQVQAKWRSHHSDKWLYRVETVQL